MDAMKCMISAITSYSKTGSKFDNVTVQNTCERHARRYPAEIKLNATNVVGVSWCYCRRYLIVEGKRETTRRGRRRRFGSYGSDAIRNNGLLVRRDKVV